MNFNLSWLRELWNLNAEMAPWLLLGLFVAGALGYLVKASWWTRHLGSSRFSSHLKAVLVGIPLPLCSCSVIPTGIGLYRQGASRSAVLGFLTATPQTGVDSIMLTGGILGWPLAIVKVAAALLMGLCTATLSGLHKDPQLSQAPMEAQQNETRSLKRWWQQSAIELPAALARPYLLGLVISVALTQLLPKDSLAIFAGSPFSEMFLALLISLPMYVCATSSIPFALLLLNQGLGYGAILVFLMAGPASNAATMLVIAKEFGWRSFAIYFGVLAVGCFCIGYGMEMILPRPSSTLAIDQCEHLGWWSHVAGLLLLAAFFPHLKRPWKFQRLFNKAGHSDAIVPDREVWTLSGLTCQGCVKKLSAHLAEHGLSPLSLTLQACELSKGHGQDIAQLCVALGFKAQLTEGPTQKKPSCCGSSSCCE